MNPLPLLIFLWPAQPALQASANATETELPSAELLEYIGAMPESENGQLIDPMTLAEQPYDDEKNRLDTPDFHPQERRYESR